jgi:hypothetical protein
LQASNLRKESAIVDFLDCLWSYSHQIVNVVVCPVSRQQQLEQASEEQDMQTDDGEPPLFNLEVRLSAERSEVVAVYAGEDAATLAAAFVATHSLPVKAVAKLTRLIEENVAHYATEIEVVEVNENA